jgi:hypothetical protein
VLVGRVEGGTRGAEATSEERCQPRISSNNNRLYQSASPTLAFPSTHSDLSRRQKAESAQWSGIINAANARRNDWLARWQERTAELEQERPAYELPDELPSRIPQLHEWSALVHGVLEDESETPMVLDAEDVEIKVSACVCLCEIFMLMTCSSDRLDSPKYLCCDTLLSASYPFLGRNILRLYARPP